jgi:hypothetical protein
MSSGSKMESPALAAVGSVPEDLNELNIRYTALSSTLALPDLRTEAWHYGRPDRFLPGDLHSSSQRELSTRGLELLELLKGQENLIVLQYMADHLELLHSHLDEAHEAEGFVIVERVLPGQQFADHNGLQHWLAELSGRAVDRLECEALSRLQQVLRIDVLRDSQYSAPLHVIVEMPEDGAARCEQIVVNVQADSSLELHLHITGDNAAAQSLLHLGVSINLEQNARLRLLRYHNTGDGCDVRGHESQQLGKDARCHSTSLFIGGRHLRHDVLAGLNGPGCESILRGLYLMGGRQTASIFSHQDHRVPNAHSDLLFKGTMLDRAAASYLGQITVAPHAQGTDAYQSNRCLLLSPRARSMSSPQLEIEANDVRCSHGASVTNVSAEELFYLASRGIDPDSGRQLLISGFVAEISDLVPEGVLRDYVTSHMLDRRF